MNMPAEDSLRPPLSNSTFFMLRCVVAVACADLVVARQELIFLRVLLSHFKRRYDVTPAQVAQLKADLEHSQPVDALLPQVTDRGDREQLIIFSAMLAQADGQVHPWEEEVLKKIRLYGAPPPGDAAAAQPAPPPAIDMDAFILEVREVLGKEAYRKTMEASGVDSRTGRPAVVDAFAQASNIAGREDVYALLSETSHVSASMSRHLAPTEKLLGRGKFHWIYTAWSLLISGALLFAAAPAQQFAAARTKSIREYLLSDSNNQFNAADTESLYKTLSDPFWMSAPVVILCGAAVAFGLWRWLVYRTSEIVVTDSRLVARHGIFRVRVFKADIAALGPVDVRQSLLGDLFNYGSLRVQAPDGSCQLRAAGIKLPPLDDPYAFSALLDRIRRMLRAGIM